MGNGLAMLGHCFSGNGGRRRQVCAAVTSEAYDENVGHSFCYVRPDRLPSVGKVIDCAAEAAGEAETTTFRTISGASVSANASTPLSTSLLLNELTWPAAAAFESSDSFSAVPLQPVPRFPSGPLSGPIAERGFLSGPIERGFMSGPLDHQAALFSGPLDKPAPRLPRSLSHGLRPRSSRVAASLLRGLSRAISRGIPGGHPSTIAPKDSEPWSSGGLSSNPSSETANGTSVEGGGDGSESSSGVQWAQGKAGEDRVHVVVSEEHGWVFVGIYDGFNGPDATDYLLSNLYSAVQRELKGLFWEDKFEGCREPSDNLADTQDSDVLISTSCREGSKKSSDKRTFGGAAKKWVENQRRWKCQRDQERLELHQTLKEQLSKSSSERSTVSHHEVLTALSRALRKTEEAYLDNADKMVAENPELALMGSCVLVMLMKGEDVYLMNVGDSRAILAHKAEPDLWGSIEWINEEMVNELKVSNGEDRIDGLTSLFALQLTLDHSTSVEEVKDYGLFVFLFSLSFM